MADETENEKVESLILRRLDEMRREMATKADVGALEAKMNERFDEVELRFVKIEGRLGNVEEVTRSTLDLVVKLAGRVEDLGLGLRLSEKIVDLEKRLEVLEAPKH